MFGGNPFPGVSKELRIRYLCIGSDADNTTDSQELTRLGFPRNTIRRMQGEVHATVGKWVDRSVGRSKSTATGGSDWSKLFGPGRYWAHQGDRPSVCLCVLHHHGVGVGPVSCLMFVLALLLP